MEITIMVIEILAMEIVLDITGEPVNGSNIARTPPVVTSAPPT